MNILLFLIVKKVLLFWIMKLPLTFDLNNQVLLSSMSCYFWPNIIVIFSDRHTLHPLSYSRSHCWWSSENLSTINLKRDSFWKQQMVKVQLIWWWSSLSSMRKKIHRQETERKWNNLYGKFPEIFFFQKKLIIFLLKFFLYFKI